MLVTLTVQAEIEFKKFNEDGEVSPDYQKKLDKLMEKLEKLGLDVDLTSEDILDDQVKE